MPDSSIKRILWEQPTDIESRDLFFGIGGSFNAPTEQNTFSFINVPGSPERVVEDDAGRSWMVNTKKDEARAETSASRLLWAVGYHVDQNYTLKQVRIGGSGGGEFQFVRFKRRTSDFEHLDNWSWDNNPFVGTREFDGLRVMMATLTNWDLKEKNNSVVRPAADSSVNIFYISDLDSALGKTAVLSANRTRGNPDDYSRQRFIDGIENGTVKFHWDGDGASVVRGIAIETAQVMGRLLTRLSNDQLKDAFRAGGFSEAESLLYVQALSFRTHQLLDPAKRTYRVAQPLIKDDVVLQIQTKLKERGIDPGPLDGIFGKSTRDGVEAFQSSQGFLANGEVGVQTAEALGITLPNIS